MKKLLLTLTVLSVLFHNAKAQKGYFRIGAGYAFANAGQSRDVGGYPLNGTSTLNNNGITSLDVKNASFGAGTSANMALGCIFNDHIGFELNSVFGIAPSKYTSSIEYSDTITTQTEKFTQHARMPIFLIPSIVLQSGKKVKLYMRAGLVLPLRSRMMINISGTIVQNGLTQTYNSTGTVFTGFKVGLSGATGLSFDIAKKASFYVEANAVSMSVYVTEVSIFKGPTTTYKRKTSGGSTQGTYSYPFSNVGANVGFNFTF